MTHVSKERIDSIDLEIIKELSYDARQTADMLSRKIGKSRSTTQGRLQRLLKHNIIKIVPIVDPTAVGYEIASLFGINTLPDQVDIVADRLASEDHIYHVLVCAGRYNIMITAIFEDYEKLSDYIRTDLNQIPGIKSIDTIMIHKMLKPSIFASTDNHYRLLHKTESFRLDELDLNIVNELRHDARQSQVELGAKLGTSPTTIRRRMRRLLDNNVLKMMAVTNPGISTYALRVAIGIRTHHGTSHKVENELVSQTSITHAVSCSGRYNIIVWAHFNTYHDFSYFMMEYFEHIPEIDMHETLMILRPVKEVFLTHE